MSSHRATEIEDLERKVSLLEERLADLVSRPEFRVGDRIVGLVSSRKTPRPRTDVPASLPEAARARKLRLRLEELRHLVELTEQGLRLELGSLVIGVRENPASVLSAPLELAGIAVDRSLAALARRFGDLWRPVGLRILNAEGGQGRGPRGDLQVTVYADVDPDRIDGATTWLASVTEVLAEVVGATVTVLLSAPSRSPEVLSHLLGHPRIHFAEPSPPGRRRTLGPWAALKALEAIDRHRRQDLFLVRGPGVFRGLQLSELIGLRPGLAGRTWSYLVDPRAFEPAVRVLRLRRMARRVRGLLCQTPEARSYLKALMGGGPATPIALLPPMVPRVEDAPRPSPGGRPPRLVYAGKFSPPYRILELLEGFGEIQSRLPGAELHVVGDKVHNQPPVDGFERRILAGLSRPGVIWHGGVTRRETLDIIRNCDLAFSWRDETFDTSLELATKVLEYAACGVPVLLNPTKMHKRLFGEGYAGFVATGADLLRAVTNLATDSLSYQQAAQSSLQVAAGFTFERSGQALAEILGGAGAGTVVAD